MRRLQGIDRNGQYRKLSKKQEASFRQWARDNYKLFDPIDPLWHPVVRQECGLMNGREVLRSFNREKEDD